MAFIKAVLVDEIPEGQGKEVEVGGKLLAVFHSEGKFYAVNHACTHRSAPLANGELVGTEVICPLHGSAFDLETGEALCPPANEPVIAYAVQVVNDEVQVDV